jgi:hypothetical protein
MSDVPTDEGPDPDSNENARDFFADALSPVIDPDYDARAAAQTEDRGTGENPPKTKRP